VNHAGFLVAPPEIVAETGALLSLSASSCAPSTPASDQQQFMLSQLVFRLLAATDGHANNYSLYHGREGGFGLTPLYDILSTWPVVGKRADQLDANSDRLFRRRWKRPLPETSRRDEYVRTTIRVPLNLQEK